MRSFHARRAAMIGTAALLLVAPGASLVNAETAAPALPADLVAAIQRDLGLTPAQYLDRAETGQNLAKFADSIRATFPESFAGAWLDQAGAPMIGLADGPDKAAARTAVEVAGYQVKDQSRSERTLFDLLGQLDDWVEQLPAPLSGLVNGAKIDPANNDIALEVKDTAAGQGLQLPDFLNFVRMAQGPTPGPLGPLGPSGWSGSSDPTTTTPPTTTPPTNTPGVPSTITINPVTGATVGKLTTLIAKVNPAAAGGTVTFEDDKNSYEEVPVGADGTARMEWSPETAGKVTVKAIFSGRDGVKSSTTTQEVTVAKGDSNPVASTITLNPIKGATVDKAITLKAKVNPAAAGGTVAFEVNEENIRYISNEVPIGTDGTATMEWRPENAGKATVTATFSGRDGVAGSTTTQQVTVAGAPKPEQPAPDAILGGQGYRSGETASDPCSFGFNATDGDGNAVNITAGHCDNDRGNDTRVFKGGQYVGTFGKAVTNGFDYGLINIDAAAAHRFQNNYVDTYGGAPLRITGTADPVVGAPVCKSGEITGFTCGKITAVGVPINTGPHGATVPNSFEATVCAIPGDSGGPYMTGTKALGLAAGGYWECNNSTKSFAQPINSILADNPGLKIRTN